MLVLEAVYEKLTDNKVEYSNPDQTRTFCQWLVGFVDNNSMLLKLENLGFDLAEVKLLAEASTYFRG